MKPDKIEINPDRWKEKNAKISASMMGIKNAEKWTPETVLPILFKMMEAIEANPENYIYLGTLIKDFRGDGMYNQLWSQWTKKFIGNEKVTRAINMIDSYFESTIVERAMTGKYVPSIAIFTLKNKYNWKDKQEIDLSGNM